MKAYLVSALATFLGCAPRPAVTAERAAADLCDDARAWPLVVEGNRMFVDAVVDAPTGPARLRLMVDTGGNAPGVVLFRSAANRAGFADALAVPRAFTVDGRPGALPDGARWVVVDDVQPGSLPSRTRPHESDGQIGAGFLSRFRLCIDPSVGRMALGGPDVAPITSASPGIALELAEEAPFGARYPFVRAHVGERALSLLVDTGATAGMLHARRLSALSTLFPSADVASGEWDMVAGDFATERVVRVSSLVAATFDLGAATFVSRRDGTFPALFTPLPGGGPDGVIGNDVWLRHRVLIDYGTGRLFVWPQRAAEEPSARVPVSLSFDVRGCPTVARIDVQTRAEGLAERDVITQIDGVLTCGLSHVAVSSRLARPLGTQLSLTVVREGRTLDVLVTSRAALSTLAGAR